MNINTLDNRQFNISSFLKNDDFCKERHIPLSKLSDYYVIYKIYNKKNNKVYIGKTKNIKRRANEYITEYFNKTGKQRLIWKAMQKYGIENFVMMPIDITQDKKFAAEKEIYYIMNFHSYDLSVGYNESIQSRDSVDSLSYHTPRKQLSDEKMKRSKIFCGINPDTKEIIFSTGLKLFGDYIGRGKDEVKSAAKRSSSLNNYFLFYINNNDFNNQIEYALKYNKKDKKLVDYDKFFYLANILCEILNNNRNEHNFNLKFIHQSDENEDGYVFENPDVFIKYYRNLVINKKINPILYKIG